MRRPPRTRRSRPPPSSASDREQPLPRRSARGRTAARAIRRSFRRGLALPHIASVRSRLDARQFNRKPMRSDTLNPVSQLGCRTEQDPRETRDNLMPAGACVGGTTASAGRDGRQVEAAAKGVKRVERRSVSSEASGLGATRIDGTTREWTEAPLRAASPRRPGRQYKRPPGLALHFAEAGARQINRKPGLIPSTGAAAARAAAAEA